MSGYTLATDHVFDTGSNLNAVVIMAKAPVPNEVKTRLIPPLESEAASLLYHSFLLDKIEQVKSIEARHFVAYTPQTSESFFRSIIPPGFDLRRLKRDLEPPSKNCYFCENTYRAISFLHF